MSVILGWTLVILCLLTYMASLLVSLITYFKTTPAPGGRQFAGADDLKGIAEVLDKLAGVLDKFGKLTVPVQWALLGMLNIGVGAYLITHKPF